MDRDKVLQELYNKADRYMIIKEHIYVKGKKSSVSNTDFDYGTLITFEELVNMEFIKINQKHLKFFDPRQKVQFDKLYNSKEIPDIGYAIQFLVYLDRSKI